MAQAGVNTQQLRAQAGDQLGFYAVFALSQSFSEAVEEASKQVSKQLVSLSEVFNRVNTDSAARSRIHERIAKLAQTSTVQSYGQLVTRREGAASRLHYRAGVNRFAAGKMLEALQDPNFVAWAPDGILFANTEVLDRIAAQWHRLNFGAAGGRQGARPATFVVRFGSLVVAALGLPAGPSPSFAMPRGFWTTPEGQRVGWGANSPGSDFFTPLLSSGGSSYSARKHRPLGNASRQTAGIAAKNFLDAGVARIAKELGPAYLTYYKDLFALAKANKGPLAGKVLVNPKRLPVSVRGA